MPVIANAAKALRKDRRRAIVNHRVRQQTYSVIKKFIKTKDASLLPKLYSTVDIAAKKHIIHKNKAARIKSRLNRLVNLAPTK